MLFDRSARVVGEARRELTQHYPRPGWVEHDPEEIWSGVLACVRELIARVDIARIVGIGITNQRETSLLWDRADGCAIGRAIVWQDRRTSDRCAELRADGIEAEVQAKTGLLLDPYFSATKLGWMLDNLSGARDRAERGDLAFGTVDSFLLWRLSGGKVHASDLTNAARTALCDIRLGQWDPELCRLFGVPQSVLGRICDSSGVIGECDPALFGRTIPLAGVAGDQQAALFGQACLEPGMAKSTYGTGCFLLLNTGDEAVRSTHRMLTTPAWRIGGRTTFALEGSIFVAGSAIQWLRDRMGLVGSAAESETLARSAADDHGVSFVTAFTGLGAPHWNAEARAAVFGLSLDSGKAELVRAALEAVAFQTRELTDAMAGDWGGALATLRVDGGMAANGWLCQFLADILDRPLERPANLETTALGAAFHAGLATGVWSGLGEIARTWEARDRFEPAMDEDRRERLIGQWRDALSRVVGG